MSKKQTPKSIKEYALKAGFKVNIANQLQAFYDHAHGKTRVNIFQPRVWESWISKGIVDRESNSVIMDKGLREGNGLSWILLGQVMEGLLEIVKEKES